MGSIKSFVIVAMIALVSAALPSPARDREAKRADPSAQARGSRRAPLATRNPGYEFVSDATGLRFKYWTEDRQPDGLIDRFVMPTKMGDLCFSLGGAGAAVGVGASFWRLTYLDADELGRVQITLAAGGQEAHFLQYPSGALQMIASPSGPDCDVIRYSPVMEALLDARDLVASELMETADSDGNLTPGDPLAALSGVVRSFLELPNNLSGCSGAADPRAGACYYDCRTGPGAFECCSKCCDIDGLITSGTCASIARLACKGPLCRYLTRGCGGLADVMRSLCMGHNCGGLPGDPDCTSPPPCQGTCMEFCGPGHSRKCGACPAGTECCD